MDEERLRNLIAETVGSLIAPLRAEISEIKTDIGQLKTDVGQLKTDVGQLKTDVNGLKLSFDRLFCLHQNSTKGRTDHLIPIPNQFGHQPRDFPVTIESLLIAGNERLPSDPTRFPHWNAERSKELLEFYGETEQSGSEDEIEKKRGEDSKKSRARRLRVAKRIGVTESQLNFAKLSL